MATSVEAPTDRSDWGNQHLNRLADAVSELQGIANGGDIPAPGLTYAFRGNSPPTALNLGIGTVFSHGDNSGGGQNFTSNLAIGGGIGGVGQPQLGNLGSITTGYDNTALGMATLISLTTGHGNVSVGNDNMYVATTAIGNTCVGAQTAQGIVAGSNNVAVGSGALQFAGDVSFCTAVGYGTLSKTTVNTQTAVGYAAAQNVTSALNITAVGYEALNALVTGNFCTAVGNSALIVATNFSNTAVGYASGFGLTTGHDDTFVGTQAGQNLVTGQGVTCVGSGAGHTSTTDSHYMTLIGYNTIGTGAGAVAIGVDSAGNSASALSNQIKLGTVNHHLLLMTKVAPADASLAASTFTLWLDDTNGAAKLMVKAKQADGTVKTAAVALA